MGKQKNKKKVSQPPTSVEKEAHKGEEEKVAYVDTPAEGSERASSPVQASPPPPEGIPASDPAPAVIDSDALIDEATKPLLAQISELKHSAGRDKEQLTVCHAQELETLNASISQIRKDLEAALEEKSQLNTRLAQSQEQMTELKSSAAKTADLESRLKEAEHFEIKWKEEEEKRTKAIGLLKAVRQKLVKADKERDDAKLQLASQSSTDETHAKEIADLQLRITQQQTAAENLRLNENAQTTARMKEKELEWEQERSLMKSVHARDVKTLKDEQKKEVDTIHGAHNQVTKSLQAQIRLLDGDLKQTHSKEAKLSETLAAVEEELSSVKTQHSNSSIEVVDLKAQLREIQTKAASTDVQSPKGTATDGSSSPKSSKIDLRRLLADAEVKFSAKLAEMEDTLQRVNTERQSTEAEFAKDLESRSSEVSRLRQLLEDTKHKAEQMFYDTQQWQKTKEGLLKSLSDSNKVVASHAESQAALRQNMMELKEQEALMQAAISELKEQVLLKDKLLSSAQSDETGIKETIAAQTLRAEIQKLKAAAALTETQRGAGVSGGYFNAGVILPTINGKEQDSNQVASINTRSAGSSLEINRQTKTHTEEEEINLEYLRNVILQFLERKEMRANLVQVLSVILRFTPQETRRLVANATS